MRKKPLYSFEEVAVKIGQKNALELLARDFWIGTITRHCYWVSHETYGRTIERGETYYFRNPGVPIEQEQTYVSQHNLKPESADICFFRDAFAGFCKSSGVTRDTAPADIATVPFTRYKKPFVDGYLKPLLISHEGLAIWARKNGITVPQTLRPFVYLDSDAPSTRLIPLFEAAKNARRQLSEQGRLKQRKGKTIIDGVLLTRIRKLAPRIPQRDLITPLRKHRKVWDS